MTEARHFARTTSFVRRGDRMTRSQEAAWERYRDDFVLEIERSGGMTSVAPDQLIDLDTAFEGVTGDLIVEIGTGTSDQIVHAASERRNDRFLGFEVWRPGIAQGLIKANQAGVSNIRFIQADAEQGLIQLIAEGAAAEVWTFFPDPWQKARHHKRRLVKESFATDVAHVLRDGGVWRLATDWRGYASHMIHVLSEHPDFDVFNEGRYEGRTMTKFESRAEDEGRFAYDLIAYRHPR
ncbi:tRNA (guanosine(46)-N7)-methyltransferase TrmB [Bowdeniella nasicola]|uniref:tRNA (guanine-N(7)-)-methyltransferase n=1 Tax=Bowdeniella nasicola TaxID=208480 RepID=A0A1Q5Q4K6_9ACTO|nr:tRNA (guanosine(46)-N7)-methyltransferase TrmB [Bowdeniella nasicola]OKL54721.1 tRNA (guanosine(46)-N7)-methyltransferase TrmB [Bowdeniella nasicola]